MWFELGAISAVIFLVCLWKDQGHLQGRDFIEALGIFVAGWISAALVVAGVLEYFDFFNKKFFQRREKKQA